MALGTHKVPGASLVSGGLPGYRGRLSALMCVWFGRVVVF